MIDKDKFVKEILDKLDKLEGKPVSPKSVSMEKVILFLLETAVSGNFRGIVSVKIFDNDISTPRIDQFEVLVEDKYRFIDSE